MNLSPRHATPTFIAFDELGAGDGRVAKASSAFAVAGPGPRGETMDECSAAEPQLIKNRSPQRHRGHREESFDQFRRCNDRLLALMPEFLRDFCAYVVNIF